MHAVLHDVQLPAKRQGRLCAGKLAEVNGAAAVAAAEAGAAERLVAMLRQRAPSQPVRSLLLCAAKRSKTPAYAVVSGWRATRATAHYLSASG